MKVDEIVERLDLEAVSKAIDGGEGEVPLREGNKEDVRRVVSAVIEKWVPKDLDRFTGPLETEKEIWLDVGAMGRVHGFVDILTPQVTKEKKALTVLDWKTSRSTLDDEWYRRLRDSWQWKIYAVATGAESVIYRGIGRPSFTKGKWVCDTREITWDVPGDNEKQVMGYLTGELAMRQTLVEMGLEVWPRVMPAACFAFGYFCPFLDECKNNTMPLVRILDREMSYTQLERFGLCPERHRRMLLEPDADMKEEQEFGQAAHRGLAEIYRQLWKSK